VYETEGPQLVTCHQSADRSANHGSRDRTAKIWHPAADPVARLHVGLGSLLGPDSILTVNEFLLPQLAAAQGVSENEFKILFAGRCGRTNGRVWAVIADINLAHAKRPVRDSGNDPHGRGQAVRSPASGPLLNRCEAPPCMRCRGLTWPGSALTCRFLDSPASCLAYRRTRSPCAIPGPPGPAQPLGSPPRWAAVQVVREFLLPPRHLRKSFR
jgi:hypothetical protein